MDEDGAGNEYRWETGYEKTWEAITEDPDGLLEVSVEDMIQRARRKRMLEKSNSKVKLGMMRHLFVVLDASESMRAPDLKPSRLACSARLLRGFVEEFFYLNPISQVGLVSTRNQKADLVSDLAGNPRRHAEALRRLEEAGAAGCFGEPSLQNSLELALKSLRHMPSHASREVLVVMGSLTTCDPGDINATIASCKAHNVRCSVIALAAEVRIYKELAKVTGGTFNVILDDLHLRDLLTAQLEPPASTQATEPTLIRMGFPCHTGEGVGDGGAVLGLCMCHLDTPSDCKLSTSGFLCPQCQAKYCELPVECKCCGLTLVSAPHLARSYHHLFPLPVFEEVPAKSSEVEYCDACVRKFRDGKDSTLYKCPNCRKVFCCDCDVFFHETLHSCAGCASMKQTVQQRTSQQVVNS